MSMVGLKLGKNNEHQCHCRARYNGLLLPTKKDRQFFKPTVYRDYQQDL